MARSKRWTDDGLIAAVSVSYSKAEVLRRLGHKPSGGNYLTLRRSIEDLGLDISHFLGAAHLRGKSHNWGKRIPTEDLFRERREASGGTLKRALFERGLLPNRCSLCGQPPEWNGRPLVLQIDHINGIHDDNRLENLRILCGHCHSQTDNYCGKNKRALYSGQDSNLQMGIKPRTDLNRPRKPIPAPEQKLCTKCSRSIWQKSTSGLCRSCSPRKTKIAWPSNQELKELVFRLPSSKLASQLGVSDSAIGKRCREQNIPKPPRGYWAKLRLTS